MFSAKSVEGNCYITCRWLRLLGLIGLNPLRKEEEGKRTVAAKKKA